MHKHEYNLKQSQLYYSNLKKKKLEQVEIMHSVLAYTFFKSYIFKICNSF